MRVSRQAVAALIADRCKSVTNATGYYGQVGRTLGGNYHEDPPTKGNRDPRVAPYFILFPSAGVNPPQETLVPSTAELTLPVSITAVGGDIDDLLALLDRLDAALYQWRPSSPGYLFSPLDRPLGWASPGNLTDETTTPPRLYTVLEYQTTITANDKEPASG